MLKGFFIIIKKYNQYFLKKKEKNHIVKNQYIDY